MDGMVKIVYRSNDIYDRNGWEIDWFLGRKPEVMDSLMLAALNFVNAQNEMLGEKKKVRVFLNILKGTKNPQIMIDFYKRHGFEQYGGTVYGQYNLNLQKHV